ncbi:MAG: hypothetical protein EXR72_24130 [Myxococcales bacterium]|nr:hypothetical protein [Myxococcales bacterium]
MPTRLLALLVVSLLAGCSGHASYDDVAYFPDLARPDLSVALDGAASEPDLAMGPFDSAAPVDSATPRDLTFVFPSEDLTAQPPFCRPGQGCNKLGPLCGMVCCNAGERCDPATKKCRCGMGAACLVGDQCGKPGPIGADFCGTVCCGPVSMIGCPK